MRRLARILRAGSRRGSGVLLLCVALFVQVRDVRADVSPAIAPSKITFDEPIGQGERVTLPELTISNRGDSSGLFKMDVFHFANQTELWAEPSWFRIEPEQFVLEPGESQRVNVRMDIPRDARPLAYQVFVRTAVRSPDAGTGGASVGGAVALTLKFTVKNVNSHFYDPVVDFFQDRAPFSYLGVSLLVALLAGYLFNQRYGLDFDINLGVRRKD